MVPIAEKERVKALIRDTLTLLCRNGLPFSDKFTIEALIGITIDEGDVVLMSMNEMVKSDAQKQNLPSEECAVQDSASHRNSGSRRESGHRRRLKKSKFTSVNRHKRPHADESRDSADDDAGEEPLSPLREDTNSDQQQEPDPKRVKSEQSESADNTKRELGDVNEQASDKIQEKCDDDLQQDVNETDNQNDIIIKQEVDDDIEWISSSFQSEASVPPEMMSETSRSSYQNQMFPSGMPFQRTATVTSADSGPGPSEQEQGLCGTGYTAEQLASHWTQNHSGNWSNITSPSQLMPFHCDICGKSYRTKDYLQRHQKSHDTSLIMCKKCTQYFTDKQQYDAHVEMKHGDMEKKHVCVMCGRGFNRAQYLERHVQKHGCEVSSSLPPSMPSILSSNAYYANEQLH